MFMAETGIDPGYGIGVRGQTLDLEPASSSLAPGAVTTRRTS